MITYYSQSLFTVTENVLINHDELTWKKAFSLGPVQAKSSLSPVQSSPVQSSPVQSSPVQSSPVQQLQYACAATSLPKQQTFVV